MKKLVLLLAFLAVLFYWLSDRYAIKTGHSEQGGYRIVIVDKQVGKVIPLIGK